MIRTFKYPLLPNSRQERILSGWLELNRHLYNAALEQRREAYRMQGKSLSYFTQTKDLTELRAGDERYKTVPVEISRSALRTLHRAFDGFFRRVKAGAKPGYPRFRGRERYDSFNIGRAIVRSNRVYVPKLGGVKFNRYRDVEGVVRDVTLRKKNGKWFVCISCDLGEAPQKIPVAKAVGIDLGLTSFAALSDGSVIENPRYFNVGQESLAVRQRKLARKRHGSNSRQRARILVGKSYEHIHNQRLDFSRKLAKELFNRFDLIAYEDLNIRAMVQSYLSKSISDASWKIFIGALNNRAENAGRWAVPVNPRNTTKMCSRCGELVPKDLSERVHSCSCGLVLNRDINAAINILALGKAWSLFQPKAHIEPLPAPLAMKIKRKENEKMTPEERAEKELAEELGFSIKPCEHLDCTQAVAIDKRGAHAHWPRASFDLWSLALRQRVELNKLKNA